MNYTNAKLIHYQMIERDTELQITSEPAIAYSTCYRLPFLSLFHTDCMKIMKQYPDKYFDLAVVDPPYGIGMDGGKRGKATYTQKNWDKSIPSKEYFDELLRISKNQIIWGGNYFGLPPTPCFLIWDKLNGDSFFADGEVAWTSFSTPLKIYKHAYIGRYNPEPIKIHPTQKPIALYDWILKNYAKENYKIIDTHFGSGSIALAIDKANRLDKMNLHLTAVEIDLDYVNASIKRISESIKQGTLSF
jgi:site-specific DNA-methyltransferase (adenine-specific)